MTAVTRERCLRCRRAAAACFCGHLARVESSTRVCLLQHPRERDVAIGTARMAHLSLPNSELHIGVEFDSHERVRDLIDGGDAALLFPGEGGKSCDRKPRTLFVVDGTWAQAKKLVQKNRCLQALPRFAIAPPRPSNYRIRKEPADHCVSTIEAVVQALGELETDRDFRPVLTAFDRMIDLQIDRAAQNRDPTRYRKRRPPRKPRDQDIRELREHPERAVALYAEANAHPLGSGVPGEPELVHLVALRPLTGERFEAIVAPRRPLAEATPLHLEIAAQRLLSAESIDSAVARFRAFARSGDLYYGWGNYCVDLLANEGVLELKHFDLRPVAMRRLRRNPGGIDNAPAALGHPAPLEALGEGRAGRRLAVLRALFELLI